MDKAVILTPPTMIGNNMRGCHDECQVVNPALHVTSLSTPIRIVDTFIGSHTTIAVEKKRESKGVE
jgi:hypothetical protein